MPPGCGFLKRKNISAAYAVTVQLCLFCFKKLCSHSDGKFRCGKQKKETEMQDLGFLRTGLMFELMRNKGQQVAARSCVPNGEQSRRMQEAGKWQKKNKNFLNFPSFIETKVLNSL